jgi:ankyrin repeat protein
MMNDDSHTSFYEIRDAYLSDLAAASAAVAADGSLLDVRSRLGETLLHWLAVEDAIPAVQSLIASGAAIDPTNKFGATPLMEAASLGYEAMCRLLLMHGANVRYISPRGDSALCHAARSRQLGTLQILLSQMQPDESLQPFFQDIELDLIFDTEDEVTRLLESRGLVPRRQDD